MSIWQSMMIGLARSRAMKNAMQGSVLTRRLAKRFIGGEDISAAIAQVEHLKKQGLCASLYYLGEYIGAEELIEENVAHIITAAEKLGQTHCDVHISVDPTQIGYALSDEVGQRNALRIGQVISQQRRQDRRTLMMLDMEDFSYVQKTLDLRARLSRENTPVAITIQAYLHRSEVDLDQLIREGATVRLVKGAFAERQEYAWTRKADIDHRYLCLVQKLLSSEARERSVYPIFATHDERIIAAIKPMLHEQHWDTSDYEFEMLYGVRVALQRSLVQEGHMVRLYLPFGAQWWPYTARRIGENPANLLFIWRAVWNNDLMPAGSSS